MAVALHPIGNCVSISDLYQIVSYFLLYCNKVKNILSNPCSSYVIAMQPRCAIATASAYDKADHVRIACKRTQFQGNPARKKGKAYGLCPFKSTGTVLFLPHPKRRNARPGSGFLLPLPQRISGNCRPQRLRQIHDFVPDRRFAHPRQRRHHVLWGKWPGL